MRRSRPFGTEGLVLPADVIELRDEYRVEIDAPGLELDRVSVSPGPVRGTLSVSAAPRPPGEPGGQLLLAERTARARASPTQVRHLPIGWDADVANARQSLQNGVLRITIPKLERDKARSGGT